MTTDEIIRQLRHTAEHIEEQSISDLLSQAADRLEDLDERIAIVMEASKLNDEIFSQKEMTGNGRQGTAFH